MERIEEETARMVHEAQRLIAEIRGLLQTSREIREAGPPGWKPGGVLSAAESSAKAEGERLFREDMEAIRQQIEVNGRSKGTSSRQSKTEKRAKRWRPLV
jgi:hypothetical protein